MTAFWELKKIWLKRKGILLLMLAVICKAVTVFWRDDLAYISQAQENNKPQFLSYMDTLEGALTPEKEAYLAETEAYFLAEKARWEQCDADFVSGKITKPEWAAGVLAHERTEDAEAAFAPVRTEYEHAKSDPRCRFLYTNGWSVLLARDAPDWILILLLAVLTVPVICAEGGMESLLDAAPNGRTRLRAGKLLSVMFSAGIITVLLFLTEVLCISMRYGLPAGASPLQSVPQFYQSEWNLTLSQAAGVTLLHRLTGVCEAASIGVTAALLTKQPVPSMLTMLLTVLLPGVIWNRQEPLGYTAPLPAGFLRSAGFLKNHFSIPGAEFEPEEIVRNLPLTDITMKQYRETLVLVLAVTAGLCTFCILSAKLRRGHFRMLPLFCMCLFLTGCCAEHPDAARFSSSRPNLENAAYSIYEKHDGNNSVLMLVKKDGSGEIPLIRDPFREGETAPMIAAFYLTDDAAYRMEYDGYASCVIRTDLRDFSETVLCTLDDGTPDRTAMLGLDAYFPHPYALNTARGRQFFVINQNRIIMETNEGICLTENGKIRVLVREKVTSWCFENGVIWYADRACRVHQYTMADGTDIILDIGYAQEIALTDAGLELLDTPAVF